MSLLAAILFIATAGAAPLGAVAEPASAGGHLAPARPTIAVPDLLASHTPAEDAAMLSQFVRTAVVRAEVWDVVDKNNMDKVLAEQAFQQTGCTSQECAVKLGRILKVDRILIGTYGVYADSRVLTAQIVEVETGRITASESITIPAGEKIEETAARFVRSLIDHPVAAGSPAPSRSSTPEHSADGMPWIGDSPVQPARRQAAVDEAALPRQRSPWTWAVVAAVLVAAFTGVLVAAN